MMDWKNLLSILGRAPPTDDDQSANGQSAGEPSTDGTSEGKPLERSRTSIDFGNFTNSLLEGKAIPLTDITVHGNESNGGKLPSRPSQTSIPHIALSDDLKPTDGVPIKPSVAKENRHMKRKAARQLVYSVLRNGLCWLFVSCVLVIALEDVATIREWLDDARICIIVLTIVGLLGLPFQAVHVIREFRNKRPSLLATMLRQARDTKDFKEMVRERQLSPPYLAVEVSLKSGAIARVRKEADGWMLTTRRNIKALDFNSWLDISVPIADQRWEDMGSFWIVLTKEYRFLDKTVEQATQEEVAQFKRDCAFDKYMYFMDFQYLLDVQEGDYFPDAEVCLVYQKNRPPLYRLIIYKVFLCLALDVFYQMAFYLATKHAKDYYFVKFIER
ncbi:hypothetical protein LSH36_18g05061 [Paralvinella palmiformis]|uniref:Uncharacterized protein n=1 Tax=Paralvinella palmiformis TaxID=53620 RepID=A0AAD9KBR0_9ANNE|nr:hypothetical protein LSH36_18g05061 [Paralvinella palmiformis]